MRKITQRLLLLVLMLVPMLAMSQVTVEQLAMETGVDSTKWVALPADTAVTKTILTNGGDSRASGVAEIGFDFVFGGVSYHQFSANTDGNLRFGSEATGTLGYSTPFGELHIGNNLPKINVLGCDGNMKQGGYVKYAVLGTMPSRVLVVEFKTARYGSSASTSDLMWQIQLSETSNDIQIVYGPDATESTPSSFQVGLAASETDVITINTTTNAIRTGVTELTSYQWPAPSTYYRFYAPTCIKPSDLQLTDVTTNTAEFSWASLESQTSWQYVCVESSIDVDWSTAESVSLPSASISGLQPNTEYTMYVRTNCGADGTSDIISMTFRTNCSDFDVPYFDSFESYAEGAMPECWISNNGESSVFKTGRYIQTSHTGQNSLRIGALDIVVAPRVKLAANELMVLAYVKPSSASIAPLEVGYVTNLSLMDFTPIKSITPISDIYQEYLIDYSSLDITDTVYVAFRYNEDEYSVYDIDDISILKSLSCPRPEYAFVRNVTHNSAIVEWDGNENVSYYEVAYGLTDTLEDATVQSVEVGESSYMITNLMNNTTYHAWVRNVCDPDSSLWLYAGNFATKNVCANVINAEVSSVGYTSAAINWTRDNTYGEEITSVDLSYRKSSSPVWSAPISIATDNYYILNGLEMGTSYQVRLSTHCGTDTSDLVTVDFFTASCSEEIVGDGLSTTLQFPFGGNYKYAYSQMLYPASKLVGIDTIKGISFHIEASQDNDRLVDVYLANVSQTSLTSSTVIPYNQLHKVKSNFTVVINKGWATIPFDSIFVYDGVSNLVVALDDNTGAYEDNIPVFTNTFGSSIYKRQDWENLNPADSSIYYTAKAIVPDIKFAISCANDISCEAPTVAFSDITGTSVSVNWVGNANETQWVVGYKLANTNDWTSETVTTASHTFTGLQSGSSYDIRVGSICGTDTMYATLQVFTDCIPNNIPFAENFDDAELPCWIAGGLEDDYVDIEWNYEDQLLEWGYQGGYMILPAMSEELNTLQISFSLGASTSYDDGILIVWAGSDPNNLSTFIPIDTLVANAGAPMAPQLVAFNNYGSNGHYIMFSSYGDIYVDNILVDAIPECSMPSNLVISNITSSSATVTWTDDGTMVEKWLVSYVKDGEELANEVEILADEGKTYTFTDLQSNSNYTVYVTTICHNGDSNITLYPATFRTECADITIPYIETFEGLEMNDFHLCWYRDDPASIDSPDLPYYYIQAPAIYVGEGDGATVTITDNKTITSPRVAIAINQLSVNFDLKFQSTANSGQLVVGYVNHVGDSVIAVDTISAANTDWANYTVNFNALSATDSGYIVFKNINNQTVWDDWDYTTYHYLIWLDNVDFSAYSSCVRPFNASISNITTTTANISFSDTASATGYTIAWSTENNIESANTLDVTSTTATITNLQASTTYYAWVRANCSATSHSAWVAVGKFMTECNPLPIPYFENFDDYTYGIGEDDSTPLEYPNHTKPNCWKFVGLNPIGFPYAMISDYPDYATSGSNVLFAESSSDNYIYLVLPAFTVPTDSLQLTFTYTNADISNLPEEFVLGIMTDPTDASTFVMLQDYPTNDVATVVEHIFALDPAVAANTNYNIAFRLGGEDSYGQDLAIDDVSVTYAPSCYKPINIHATSVTSSTVDIAWTGDAANYEVQYRAAATDTWNQVAVATDAVALTNLNANTAYELQVRSICGAGDTSDWSYVFNFKTLCSAVAVPWSENFESYATATGISSRSGRPLEYPNHTLPECWLFSEMTHSAYGGPAVWMSNYSNSSWAEYYQIDGITLRMVSNSNLPTYAVLPAMNAPIDTLVMNFDYVMPSYAEPLEVGVVTNPYDFSTYTSLELFPVSDTARSAEHYFVYDNLDENQTYYIVFKTGMTSGDATAIDNITVDYIPSCIRPNSVEVSEIMNNSAKVKWNTTTASSVVNYRASDSDVWTSVAANADSIVLTGLIGNTTYQVAVSGICSENDTSDMSDIVTFTTICDPYAIPYLEDFSTISDIDNLNCWDFYKGIADDVIAGTAPLLQESTSTYARWKVETDTVEPLHSSHMYLNIYGENCAKWAVSPLVVISSDANLSFDVAFSKYSDYSDAVDYSDDKFYVLATADNGATWTKVATWGPDADNTYPMDSLSLEGDSINVSLSQFAGQHIRLAFYGESTVYNGDNNLHIDNVAVNGTPCSEPTDVVVTPEATSAVMTWDGGENFELAIRESGANLWNDSVEVAALTYTFTGLSPETNYEYRLRQICSAGLTSEWVTGAFTTLALPCGVPVVSVTDITGDGATITWTAGENNTAWEVNVFNAMINENYDVTDATYAIEGLVQATEYSVAVRAKCSETIYSDWSDTITFTTLDCLPVSGVTAGEITENSAVITWTAGGAETQWIVNYGEMGFGQGQGIFDTVSATSYAITGLESESDYDVYVRALCGDDFASAWSTPVCQFQTLVGGAEGIDGINGNFQFAIYPNPTSGATTISLTGVEGKVTISIVDMNGRMVTNEVMECGSDCEKRVDVSGLAQGTYFVRVLGDDINSVRKLIVR